MKSFTALSLGLLAASASAAPAVLSPRAPTYTKNNETANVYGGNTNATITAANKNAASEKLGTSLLNITQVSVPLQYNNNTPPLGGNNPKDGTNYTMAYKGQPAGGLLIEKPVYEAESNFDFQSLNLALNQELIELDLFNYGLAKFSDKEFDEAGITAEYREIIRYFAQQEIGHATAISNMLGPERSAKQCTYQYPFNTVKEFILFNQLLTRFGESGVYGFLGQLNSRPASQILLQSITTEARQQYTFRQLQGLFPVPVWFETGIPQAWAWTLLSPYIKSCPSNNPTIEWPLFPTLEILNQPYALGNGPAISTNSSGLTAPGREIFFRYEKPGKTTGYDDKYTTSINAKGTPKFAAFVSSPPANRRCSRRGC